MKYTNLHINRAFGGGEGPGKPGDTVYRGPVNRGFTAISGQNEALYASHDPSWPQKSKFPMFTKFLNYLHSLKFSGDTGQSADGKVEVELPGIM